MFDFLSHINPCTVGGISRKAGLILALCISCTQVVLAQKSDKFSITDTQVNSQAVEFAYYTPYPGLTKVLLFDQNGVMVWRGQYIDKEGPNSLRLRSSYLNAGKPYVFQFEYKLDRVRVPVVGP